MNFAMRTTKPEAGNKYYIRKASGGYSNAIQGYPTDPDCDVLSNCVGYAYGRFNEIGDYGCCRYLASVNAENFMQYKGSCQSGQIPQIGACMVWQKGPTLRGSDGAGHVAIVEKVISETEVFTSESGYGSRAFWNQTRKKGADGRWGAGSAYTFLGFIYHPAIALPQASCPENTLPAEDSTADAKAVTGNSPSSESTVTVGDIVEIANNAVYYSGKAIPARILCRKWIVKAISGDRAVIDESTDGLRGINSPIHAKYLKVVSSASKEDDCHNCTAQYTISVPALNIRSGPGTNYDIVGCMTHYDECRIVQTATGQGAALWGKLMDGRGWIALDYAKKSA